MSRSKCWMVGRSGWGWESPLYCPCTCLQLKWGINFLLFSGDYQTEWERSMLRCSTMEMHGNKYLLIYSSLQPFTINLLSTMLRSISNIQHLALLLDFGGLFGFFLLSRVSYDCECLILSQYFVLSTCISLLKAHLVIFCWVFFYSIPV